MHLLIEYLVLASCLLGVVGLIQVVATRLAIPEATVLSLFGIAVGASYLAIMSLAPELAHFLLGPLIDPALPPDALVWLFLPPLVYQAALATDVRNLVQDAAAILLLAVVAVVVATAVIGVALWALAPVGLVACLLLGAIVGETDAAAVIAVFRDVGAPARLIRLVEGESLFNDAAALSLASVLLAMLTGKHPDATLLSGLQILAYSFIGGLIVGVVVGRIAAAVMLLVRGSASVEAALTMAVPYPLYLFANETLHVSGVVAVVGAGLMVSALGRTRLSPVNWGHLQMLWEQIAVLASALVFLLAAVQIPHLLVSATWHDALFLVAALSAALVARLLVLFVMLPAVSRLQSAEPISARYKLVIAWGGLRGALTLILAMQVAQTTWIPGPTRHFISITATGFALFSLLVNGTTLRWLIRALELDRLSPQEQALQRQALELSVQEIETALARTHEIFRVDAEAIAAVSQQYRRDLDVDSAVPSLHSAMSARDRLRVGLTTLAMRERDLIPEYGEGIISVRNLDALMRNAGRMVEATRTAGRSGYSRAARQILELPRSHRFARWLHRRAALDWPLAAALTQRFELFVCRRAVLSRLQEYNRCRLAPVLGDRVAQLLDSVIARRSAGADRVIQSMREDFGGFSDALERRFLSLFVLRRGRMAVRRMAAEQVISNEVLNRVEQQIERAWQRAIKRPQLHVQELGRQPV